MRNKNIHYYLIIIIYEMIFAVSLLSMMNSFFSVSFTRRAVIILKSLLLITLSLYLFTNIRIKVKNIRICLPILVFSVYELWVSNINELLMFPNAFYDILNWPLLFIVLQDYFSKYDIPYYFKKNIKRVMYILSIFSIFLVYKNLFGDSNGGGVIFNVYYLLTYSPITLLLLNNQKDKNKIVLLTAIILFLSQKRAGALAFVIGYILYLFATNAVDIKTVREKIIKNINYFVIIIFLFLLFVIANSIFHFGIVERVMMMRDDGGSGRNSIWVLIFEAFRTSSSNYQLYGHGYQSVYYKLMPYGVNRLAHNSYIEFLYDYGYVGIVLFAIFVVQLITKQIAFIKHKAYETPYLLFSIVISTVLSMYSYFFEESAIIMPIVMLWAYCFRSKKMKGIEK